MSRPGEASALAKMHSRAPAPDTVSGWIGPFYKRIVWEGARAANANDLREDILIHLIGKAREKAKSAPR